LRRGLCSGLPWSQAPHKKKRKKYRGKQSHSARESTGAMGIVASSVDFLLAAAQGPPLLGCEKPGAG
jgi:hypothetical protein